MTIFNNLKQQFRSGGAVTKIIFINTAVFISIKLIQLILTLFLIPSDSFWAYLSVPSDLTTLLHRPWTVFTYMFLHENIWHFLFNMLNFYWFGKIFNLYFNDKQTTGLYLVGGLMGALFYILSFNLFPFFSLSVHNSWLLGASGSITAIIVAAAIQAPNMELQMLLLGRIKLKYIAAFVVLMSFLGITSANGGGQLAHLGGALTGYLFVVSLRQGHDISTIFDWILNPVSNLFHPRKMKVRHTGNNRQQRPMSDAEYNVRKAQKMVEIDRILDKIKSSGYESLTAEEKKQLFDQSNKR